MFKSIAFYFLTIFFMFLWGVLWQHVDLNHVVFLGCVNVDNACFFYFAASLNFNLEFLAEIKAT